MSKLILSAFFGMLLFFSVNVANAQTAVGGGLFYSTDGVFDLGLDVRGTYQFSDNWRGALSVDWFFPKTEEVNIFGVNFEFQSRAVAVAAEVNYLFDLGSNAAVTPYVLGGLSYLSLSIDAEAGGAGAVATGDGLSVNLGGGLDFNTDSNLTPFAELKYSIGDGDYGTLVAGVKFGIN